MIPEETIATGAPKKYPDCEVKVVLDVYKSAAGYYIGTYCDCGPYSRESGYYKTYELAMKALTTGQFGRNPGYMPNNNHQTKGIV